MADVNGFLRVPWFTAGGAEHSPELLRSVAYANSGGNEGVVAPGDCRVTQTDTASGQLKISRGTVYIRNRSSGAYNQFYVATAYTDTFIDVPLNGSGIRTDLIGVRIYDPQYPGSPQPPDAASAANWEYVKPYRLSNASPAQVQAAKEGSLDLGFPAYFFAALVIPANTGTFTNGMLTNLRELAVPLQHTVIEMSGPTAEDALNGASSELGRIWPDYHPLVKVPRWATGVAVEATLSSIGQRVGGAQGLLTVVLAGGPGGNLRAQNIGFDLDPPAVGGSRSTLTVFGGFGDISHLQGKTITVQLEGRKTNAQIDTGYLVTVPGTQVGYKLTFFNRIV